jgi:hypothetical protein
MNILLERAKEERQESEEGSLIDYYGTLALDDRVDLDEDVIEAKCFEASAINNEGYEAQIRFLVEHHGAAYVRALLVQEEP